jgi:hypothetical protein
LKPTLTTHVSPGASVLPRQVSLTIAKSPAVVLPPSAASAWIWITLAAVPKVSGASPSLRTLMARWLAAAEVPAATDGSSCGAAFSVGAGSPLSATALSAVLLNGLKFVGPPIATGSRSAK